MKRYSIRLMTEILYVCSSMISFLTLIVLPGISFQCREKSAGHPTVTVVRTGLFKPTQKGEYLIYAQEIPFIDTHSTRGLYRKMT